MKKIITSESVNIGHPDKTCDTIADAFLDEALRQDPNSMMAVECAIKDDKLFVYGEATTNAKIDYDSIAREILKDIGYKNEFKNTFNKYLGNDFNLLTKEQVLENIREQFNNPVVTLNGQIEQLKSYEIPTYIEFVSELPRKEGTDKVDYKYLEQDAVSKLKDDKEKQKVLKSNKG